MNNIRVLLVESDWSDARFLQDALVEIEESTHGGEWLHTVVTHVASLDEALVMLEAEGSDMVLFNPELPDSRGIATFTALHDTAKNTPLVALLERTDEGLGRRMLRHGAQDFLIKEDVDCRPLARTMLNAIERQRFLRGTRIASAIDLETGFYHEDGFRSAAERDLQLATECDRSLALVLAELDNLRDVDAASGREAAHEMVVEAANVIRAGVRDTALVGRSSLGRFEMLSWQNNVDEIISNLQGQVQAGQHTFAFVFGYAAMRPGSGATLDDLIRDAQAVLDANKQSYPSLT